MTEMWERDLSCAVACSRCEKPLVRTEKRILSVYDHNPICLSCKAQEEKRADYPDASKQMIGTCMGETEVLYGDPGGYCYYHFYPFTCSDESPAK